MNKMQAKKKDQNEVKLQQTIKFLQEGQSRHDNGGNEQASMGFLL